MIRRLEDVKFPCGHPRTPRNTTTNRVKSRAGKVYEYEMCMTCRHGGERKFGRGATKVVASKISFAGLMGVKW